MGWTKHATIDNLIIRGNHFSGNLPLHICYLKRIQLLDISRNKLSAGIPTCLNKFIALSQNTINKIETESRVNCNNGDQTLVKPQKAEVHGAYCVFCEALYMSLRIGFFT
ncbi:hypothetical protein V8G54_011542 [Vigna mungo]|uniref:Uncharacterized protein n=1 Tax=Vigna mungo TaxID=3915 RepID=A0AAQ3NPU1_VIGMU